MSGFIFAFADPADLQEIKAVNEACLKENYSIDIYQQLVRSTVVCRESNKAKIVGYVIMANLATLDDSLITFSRTINNNKVHTVVFPLAVLPEYRGKHIAQRLLKIVIDSHKKHPIILHARKSNAIASHIYNKLGFKVFKTEPNYYHDPEEDGHVYVLTKDKKHLKLFPNTK